MSTRRKKSTSAPKRNLVRASILIDVELHARWSACAALRRVDRSAFAVDALTEACRSLVLFDRASQSDQAKGKDRLAMTESVSSAVPESA